MSNPFSPNYVSQQKGLEKEIKASQTSSNATARRERDMKSEDPQVRMHASGFIAGMKSDTTKTDRIKRGNSKVCEVRE